MSLKSYYIILGFFFVIGACKYRGSPDTETMVFHDSISQEEIKIAIEAAEEIMSNDDQNSQDIPEAIKEQKKAIITEKVVYSIFLDDGCCKENIHDPKPCCCDEVLKRYTKLFKDQNWEVAGKARNEDLILNNCMKLKEFAALVRALEAEE